MLDGPLSSYVEAFQALLERGQYAEGSSEKALRAWSHFSHWMTKCQLSAEQIDEAIVEQFLDFHLPRCDCHQAALRTRNDLSASLGHLLALLREQRVIVEPPGPSGPVAEELARYNIHMRDARGLAIGTREDRLARISLELHKRRLLHLSSHCDAIEELVHYAESSPDKKLPVHPAYLEARRVLQSHAESMSGLSMVALARNPSTSVPTSGLSTAQGSSANSPEPKPPDAIEYSLACPLPPPRTAQQW